MPRTRKDEAPIGVETPQIEGRYVELDEFTVSFETFPVASDPSPLFVGLPGDPLPGGPPGELGTGRPQQQGVQPGQRRVPSGRPRRQRRGIHLVPHCHSVSPPIRAGHGPSVDSAAPAP